MNNVFFRFQRKKLFLDRMRVSKKMHESPSSANNIYYRNFSFVQKLEPKRLKNIARKTRFKFAKTAPTAFQAPKETLKFPLNRKFQPILFTATNPRHSMQFDCLFFQQDSMNLQNLQND